jgi:hypothetical protein
MQVWEYTFYPKEYLYLKLESLFHKTLTQKCYTDSVEKNEKVRTYLKPSEMLNVIESYMRVMLSVENYGWFVYSVLFNETI